MECGIWMGGIALAGALSHRSAEIEEDSTGRRARTRSSSVSFHNRKLSSEVFWLHKIPLLCKRGLQAATSGMNASTRSVTGISSGSPSTLTMKLSIQKGMARMYVNIKNIRGDLLDGILLFIACDLLNIFIYESYLKKIIQRGLQVLL